NLAADLQRSLRASQFSMQGVILASDLDRALESCEEAIIESHSSKVGQERSLRAWLSEDLGDTDYADYLVEHCRRLDVQAGEVIAKQGGPADSMHFILEGRIGIFVDLPDGGLVRVRSLGRHTTIGEMGLITGRPRSATIRAEIASVIYELSAARYRDIERDR